MWEESQKENNKKKLLSICLQAKQSKKVPFR